MNTNFGRTLLNPEVNVPTGARTQQGCPTDTTLLNPGSEGRGEASAKARDQMLRSRFEVAFLADWSEATFIHFEVDGDLLQRAVPFELDQYHDRSFITLVAFTMHRMRLRWGGRATGWITAPLSSHRFLNLRTYVRGRGGEGIFFMHEWLNNRLAVKLGPLTFGLPYRQAMLDYAHSGDEVSGRVEAREAAGAFSGRVSGHLREAAVGGLDAFFLERYTAYTAAGFCPMYFRVWHPAWQFRTLETDAREMEGFLRGIPQEWVKSIRFVGAVFSEGVDDVWMGRPHAA